MIDESYAVIREELLGILPDVETIPRHHEVHPRERGTSGTTESSLRTFFLSVYGAGGRLPNRARCPRTAAVLDRVPHSTSNGW